MSRSLAAVASQHGAARSAYGGPALHCCPMHVVELSLLAKKIKYFPGSEGRSSHAAPLAASHAETHPMSF